LGGGFEGIALLGKWIMVQSRVILHLLIYTMATLKLLNHQFKVVSRESFSQGVARAELKCRGVEVAV